MAPKSKVSETGDIGHGVTFEVRPAKAGKPTVHVVIDGSRLPAFRLKDGSSATEQVRRLQQVDDHLARLTSGAPIDAGQPSGMAMDAMQGSQPTQPTHAATDAAQQEPPPPPHGCRREFQAPRPGDRCGWLYGPSSDGSLGCVRVASTGTVALRGLGRRRSALRSVWMLSAGSSHACPLRRL